MDIYIYIYPENKSGDSYTIPSDVFQCFLYAFSNTQKLKTLTFNTKINAVQTYLCTESSISTINLTSSITKIGAYAFRGCSNLKKITIPSSVVNIVDNAFNGCSSLTSITFSDTSGWWYADSSSATSGTSIDLSNPTTNATYFTSTYKSKYFKKS